MEGLAVKHTQPPPSKPLPGTFENLVLMHMPRAITDDVEMENVQEIIDRLTSIPRLTNGQGQYLDTLTILLEAYEKEHPPFAERRLSSRKVLKVLLEEHDMNASDLGRLLGDRSLGGRILKGERGLSKAHIRKLCERFKVGPELFFEVS